MNLFKGFSKKKDGHRQQHRGGHPHHGHPPPPYQPRIPDHVPSTQYSTVDVYASPGRSSPQYQQQQYADYNQYPPKAYSNNAPPMHPHHQQQHAAAYHQQQQQQRSMPPKNIMTTTQQHQSPKKTTSTTTTVRVPPPSSPEPPSEAAVPVVSAVSTATTVSPSSSDSEDHEITALTRQLVKKFIADIWNRGEIDLISSVCSPSLRFNGNAGFDRVGHDGLARMVGTIREALEDYHCEIHSMVVERNKAFCRLRFTGKHTGHLLGYAPTGASVAWMGATEFTVQNGKILKVWELGDVKSLEEQLSSVSPSSSVNNTRGAAE